MYVVQYRRRYVVEFTEFEIVNMSQSSGENAGRWVVQSVENF